MKNLISILIKIKVIKKIDKNILIQHIKLPLNNIIDIFLKSSLQIF